MLACSAYSSTLNMETIRSFERNAVKFLPTYRTLQAKELTLNYSNEELSIDGVTSQDSQMM
jgi:hypothetical protein